MDYNYKRCWRQNTKRFTGFRGTIVFQSSMKRYGMRRSVMADWPLILVLRVVLRHPAMTVVLLKHFDTQMPTLPSPWKHTCPSASGLVWKPNWFVNQWNLEFIFSEDFFTVSWPAWESVFCHAEVSLFSHQALHFKASWKETLLFGVRLFFGFFWNQWPPAVDCFLCQWWKSEGVLSAPQDVVSNIFTQTPEPNTWTKCTYKVPSCIVQCWAQGLFSAHRTCNTCSPHHFQLTCTTDACLKALLLSRDSPW